MEKVLREGLEAETLRAIDPEATTAAIIELRITTRRPKPESSFASEKPGRTIEAVGPLLMWSADYPHAEGEPSVEVYRRKAGLIPDDAAEHIQTVGDAVKFIGERLGA